MTPERCPAPSRRSASRTGSRGTSPGRRGTSRRAWPWPARPATPASSRCLRDLSFVARAAGDYPRARALLEESIAAARVAGEPWHAWRSSTWLGRVAYLQGHHGEAAGRLREALAGLQDLAGPVIAVADALEWLAPAVAAAGQTERAARLYGAAARLHRDAGAARYAPDRPAYERDVAETRARLSPPEFATAWAEGEAMTLEQAVADALDAAPAGA